MFAATVIPFSARDSRTDEEKYEAALETQARDRDPEAWDLLDSEQSLSRCPFCKSHTCDTDCDAALEFMKED